MSREERIYSKLVHTANLYEFLYHEYPHVLEEWKRKHAVAGNDSSSITGTDADAVYNSGKKNANYKTSIEYQ